MKDELSFYRCTTRALEEQILVRDMIEGNELVGHLERLGQHLGTLYFKTFKMREVFGVLEEITGAPFQILMGRGDRRLEPGGPVVYCGRMVPGDLSELVHAIRDVRSMLVSDTPSDAQREHIEKWRAFEATSSLRDEDPKALETIRRYLDRFRRETPELISVFSTW